MANYTSTHTGAVIDASVTKVSASGVTQADFTKLNAVTSSATELNLLDGVTSTTAEINILDGVTSTAAEINILDGATLSVTELNYLDGADSSITTLSLPDNTTITAFGASLIDDANASTARSTLNVDVAGTDNSTNVTLVTTSYDYLSLSGQAITLGQIDISDDTNLVGGDGLALTGDTLSVNVDDSSIEINSDTLRVKALGITNAMLGGSIANAKLSNSSVSYGGISLSLGGSDATPAFDLSDATSLPIIAGTTGTLTVARGGTGATTASGARTNLNVDVAGTDNSTDVTLVTTSHDYLSISGQAVTLGQVDISDDTNLVGGTGITLTGDTLSTTDSEIVHDNLSGFVSNEHIDHSSVSITAGTGLSGGGDITSTRTLTTDDSAIVHDDLSGFVANEHIDHSGVSITAGAGLTGGGDITATRDIAVGAGTGVTVNADDIAIGQDVATSADVEFNSVTADIIGDIRGATKFQAKADVALNIGDAVYISGISGNTPTVAIADSNDAAKMPSFGLAGSSVSINGSVEIFTFGTLPGLNTSSFSAGDILYVSTNGTSGNTLTATAPTGESSLLQNIGTVQRSHASAGSIKVGGAGRTNATPNLDDGDIFIGNGSNQAVSAALNTKIQDYLNTGVNLPSPTFSGDIDFSDASTPTLNITDTTNTITTRVASSDSNGTVGTVTDHNLNIVRNSVGHFQLYGNYTMHNQGGNDLDFRAKDSSDNVVFKVNAGTSTTEIGTLSVTGNSVLAGDLQVNGTTTTVNQTNLDVSDNIIGLNRGASSNANDSGLIIERGSTGDNVFIGWDESLDRIRFATTAADASSTGDLSLTNANIHAGRLYADVTGDVTGNADTATTLATARNFSLTGDVTAGAVSFDGSGNVALSTTIAANSVALGTDTTGNYMSDLTEGTGIDISHTPAEGSNGTITLDLTEVGFGGGANRLITDDGDGTVSTEANLTFDGTDLAIASGGKIQVDKVEGQSNNTNALFLDDDQTLASNMVSLQSVNHINIMTDGNNNGTGDFRVYNGSYDTDTADLAFRITSTSIGVFSNDVYIPATKKLYLDGGVDTYIFEESADNVIHYVGGQNKLRFNSTGAIFNDAGLALDFRVEGDTDPNLFFVDGSTDRVGIGTASPSKKLHIKDSTNEIVFIESSDANADIVGADTGGSTRFRSQSGSLDFYTGGSASNANASGSSFAMRIDSSQNVGIGTGSPLGVLNVIVPTFSSRDTDAQQVIIANSGDAGKGLRIGYDNSGHKAYMNVLDPGVAWGDLILQDGSGKIGIGTASPASKLHIRNDSAADQLRLGRVDDDSYLSVGAGANYAVYNMVTGGTIAHQFQEDGDAKMTIQTNGNVGMGTASPSSPLHISKETSTSASSTGTTLLTLTNDVGADLNQQKTFVDFTLLDDNANETPQVRIGAEVGHNGDANTQQKEGSGAFVVYTNNADTTSGDAGASLAERMRVDYQGNVGIGTQSPGAKLDVKSQINVTNSNNDSMVGLKGTNFGYSTSYKALQIGNTSGTYSIALGYDPSTNSSPSFTGDGREVLFRNGVEFTTPNSGNDGFHNDILVLKDGSVGINASNPVEKLCVRSTATYATSIEYDASTRLRIGVAGSGLATFLTDNSAACSFTNKVGIGTTAPAAKLVIDGGGDADADAGDASEYSLLINQDNNDKGIAFGFNGADDKIGAAIIAKGSGYNSNNKTDLQFYVKGSTGTTAPSLALTIDAQRNLRFENNGTNPSAVANTAFMFNDGGELKVLDELGTTTTISPHNFELIPEGASEDMAWSHHSVKGNKKVNVDMMRLARLVEELTGEKLVYTDEQ